MRLWIKKISSVHPISITALSLHPCSWCLRELYFPHLSLCCRAKTPSKNWSLVRQESCQQQRMLFALLGWLQFAVASRLCCQTSVMPWWLSAQQATLLWDLCCQWLTGWKLTKNRNTVLSECLLFLLLCSLVSWVCVHCCSSSRLNNKHQQLIKTH